MSLNFLALSSLGFFDCPFLLFVSLSCFWHLWPYFWPQMIWPWCCLHLCQPLPGPCIPVWRFSFNIVDCVNPVHASDRSRSTSMFQWSSIRRSSCSCKEVFFALVTTIFRGGIGSDSSFGTWSVTLGSTWWRWTWFPVIDQKSFRTALSSGNESNGWDPSDSLRRFWRFWPLSGCSRIKVDVRRTASPPEYFTLPSAIGNV